MIEIIKKVKNLLEAELKGSVKTFYTGDPVAVPLQALPCVYVEGVTSSVRQGATGIDEYTHNLRIGLIISKLTEANHREKENTNMTKLIELTQGRNADTTLKTNSILGVVRKNFTLGQLTENQEAEIEYGVTPRGEMITLESNITINILELVTQTRT